MRRQEIAAFHGNSVVSYFQEQQEQMKYVKSLTERLHSPINVYLWLHGIGFTPARNKSCRAYALAIAKFLLSFAFDGSTFLVGLMYLNNVHFKGMAKSRYDLAAIATIVMNFLLRVLFFNKMRQLKSNLKKLTKVYAKVCEGGKPIDSFIRKLIFALVINDAFVISSVYNSFQSYNRLVKNFNVNVFSETLSYGSIFLFRVSIMLFAFSYVTPAVTAYFSTVCFVLKGTLSELNRRILKNTHQKYSSEIYCEIMVTMSEINIFLNPFLILNFTLCLTLAFSLGYFEFFSSISKRTSVFNLLYITVVLLRFVICCLYSSSVIDAATKVKNAAHRLSMKTPKSEELECILQINEGCFGFKIMNSIVVDSSLILTSIGALISYGFLLATFNSSHV